jgi:antirestriction protein ArdC
MRASQTERAGPDWAQVLVDAVNKPGVLSEAYSRFWNYSVGNQLLAMFECMRRGLQPGPIHTFNGWLEVGRHVKKGEKAITLCMPVSVKRRRTKKEPPSTSGEPDGAGDEDTPEHITVFTYKPHWFVLSQTEGKEYVPTDLPGWSELRALQMLQIDRVAFTHPNGNCQGFARLRQIAVSPLAVLPHKTLFHELAHVVHGHTAEGIFDDHERTPVSIREVEAECVALICCESLNLLGTAESRGYIQHWLSGQTIPDRSAQKIFRAADTILKAGRPVISPDLTVQTASLT